MNNDYLQSAFQALNILSEDVFDLTDDGIRDLSEFKATEVEADDAVDIIDTDAETEEDLKTSYDGKVILECPVCHSFVFENREEINIDKSTDRVNPEDECPYCCETGGFEIIGQVAPFGEEPEHEDDTEVQEDDIEISDEAEEDSAEEEIEEESLEEPLSEGKTDCDDCEDDECRECDITDKEISDALDEQFGNNGWSSCEMTESTPNTLRVFNGDENLGEYYYVENKLVKSLPESLTVTADEGETVISSDTDSTVVTVTSGNPSNGDSVADFSEDPVENMQPSEETNSNSAETVVELSDEEKDEIENENGVEESMKSSDRIIEKELTDLDEDAFNRLGTKFLRRTYENVDNFKLSSICADDTTMMLEGAITFKSGKVKNSRFKFEAKDITHNGKARFIGENLSISSANKAFTVTGTLSDGKFVAESLNYNFSAKNPEGKSARVYGTVSLKK